MKSIQIKRHLAILFMIIFSISLFTPEKAEAAKTKTAYVDIQSGVLNVRSGPGTKYKIVGTVKKSAKLTIYSETKSGWAETRVNGKKGYASKEFLRFYKKMSNAEAKKITDKAIKSQRKLSNKYSFTKQQANSIMGPSFTQAYINKFLKYDTYAGKKNSAGQTIYEIIGTDVPYYYIWDFSWKTDGYYAPAVPTVKHYVKNGKQYLYVQQVTYSDLHGTVDEKLYLSRTSSKANWKVYNYKW